MINLILLFLFYFLNSIEHKKTSNLNRSFEPELTI